MPKYPKQVERSSRFDKWEVQVDACVGISANLIKNLK